MTKFFSLVPALVLALSSVGFAQGIEKSAANTETVKVTFSGGIDLNYVYRDSTINEIRFGIPAGGQDGTNHIAHSITLRLDIELTEKVSGVLEFATYPIGDSLGTNGVNTSGTQSFRNVYIQLAELFDPAVTVRVGQHWYNWDIRGKGSSILLDTVYSEDVDIDVNSNAGTTSGDLTSGPASRGSAGIILEYKKPEFNLTIGLLPETRAQGAAIAAQAPESPSEDDSIYFAAFKYNLDSVGKGSQLGIIATLFSWDGTAVDGVQETGIFTLGGGVDLFGLVENLEVYGEVYFQFGDAGRDALGETLDAGGFAFQAGALYKFTGEQKPWVELKLTWLSGDDDGTDDSVDNWISHENQGDLLILEHHLFGMDIDSNTMTIKISGGLTFQSKISVSAILGIATAVEDVSVGAPASDEDALGQELDVKLSYAYSKACNLTANVAFVFGSDILEGSTTEEEDSAFLYSIGANIKW